jgi:hypothetical protein
VSADEPPVGPSSPTDLPNVDGVEGRDGVHDPHIHVADLDAIAWNLPRRGERLYPPETAWPPADDDG